NYAERVIKTIKQKLLRYVMKKQSYRYVDVLQDTVKSYNDTIHGSLRDTPNVYQREKRKRILAPSVSHKKTKTVP
ncbi:hypothetical protein BOV89_12795, partial [Solemya velum gill symbiont]